MSALDQAWMNVHVVLAQAAEPSPTIVHTVFDMVVKGGWVMVPLGICSLVAVAIIVERWIVTRRSHVAPPGFTASVVAVRGSTRQALAACQASRAPVAAVLAAALKSADQGREVQEKRISEAGQREVTKLRHRMRLLSAMPQAATMLGLLGTVFGMIRTFTVVAASGESLGKTERLAQGIYEAWTATAAGLAIAIPTLVLYHILMSRIDTAAELLDHAAASWLDRDRGGSGAVAGVIERADAEVSAAVGTGSEQLVIAKS
ncbi:MAG: MotA/TolQ/ExbB proton channel family protein [Phycisphaerales bacterium]|nr:MotA/TolQ/ExbB proton channel family protein [Phycisphaerales bacterium]